MDGNGFIYCICWSCGTFYYDLLALSSHYQQYTPVPSNSQQFVNVVCSELFIRHCGSAKWVNEHQGEPYKNSNLMVGTKIGPITAKAGRGIILCVPSLTLAVDCKCPKM